ncbi:hypothetical protein DEU56DRAFT_697882, partial [Suillus clintonianus]|uniref:uncharacterized protein n=1 Tax=Suillus clintonianus TaxID=1904413 RepID=UPI001B874D90
MGDPLARRAEHLLRLHVPYPGDDLESENTFSEERFLVYRTSETHHVIMDRGSHLGDDLVILSNLLKNPRFCVSGWYAKRLIIPLNSPSSLKWKTNHYSRMGNATSKRVSAVLNGETNYPGRTSANRFDCQRVKYADDVVYEIVDRELGFHVWTDEEFLDNEKLSISHWYAKRLLKAYHEMDQLMLEAELRWEDDHLRIL